MLQKSSRTAFAFGLVLLIAVPLTTGAGKTESHRKAVMVTPASVKWAAGPPSLPSGAKMALVVGDLTKPESFTFRLKVPDGYQIPPHWHPADEHVTVLKGTVMMGTGGTLDKKKAVELPAGSFFVAPKGERHFVWTKGETIVQVHGIGPWGITYVNPADDPRPKGK